LFYFVKRLHILSSQQKFSSPVENMLTAAHFFYLNFFLSTGQLAQLCLFRGDFRWKYHHHLYNNNLKSFAMESTQIQDADWPIAKLKQANRSARPHHPSILCPYHVREPNLALNSDRSPLKTLLTDQPGKTLHRT
jgi:hypothetical protein